MSKNFAMILFEEQFTYQIQNGYFLNQTKKKGEKNTVCSFFTKKD